MFFPTKEQSIDLGADCTWAPKSFVFFGLVGRGIWIFFSLIMKKLFEWELLHHVSPYNSRMTKTELFLWKALEGTITCSKSHWELFYNQNVAKYDKNMAIRSNYVWIEFGLRKLICWKSTFFLSSLHMVCIIGLIPPRNGANHSVHQRFH
jgi:hypothetical protein